MRDEQVNVTSVLVDQPPVVPAFAYRFDGSARSIVISGRHGAVQESRELANGADVLVHSAMYPSAIDRLVARVPNVATLKASILAHQMSAEQAWRIAQDAGVKILVLSHFVPPVQFHPLENVAQRHRGSFHHQPLPPVWTCQPPSNLRIQGVAPESYATKNDQVPGRLFDELPLAEAAFEMTLDLERQADTPLRSGRRLRLRPLAQDPAPRRTPSRAAGRIDRLVGTGVYGRRRS
jgi:hypothetical protein